MTVEGLVVLVTVGSFIISAVIVVALVAFLLKAKKRAFSGSISATEFAGAPMAGTAQILSVQTTGASIRYGGNAPKYMCQIALRVQVSGRPPYDTTVRQLVDSLDIPSLRGATVPAQVDSANPSSVVIEIGQAIPPWQAASQQVAPQQDRVVARLQELERLHATAVISEAEYRVKREQIIQGF